jgi:hypothetical protein
VLLVCAADLDVERAPRAVAGERAIAAAEMAVV